MNLTVKNKIIEAMNDGLVIATGCTEPVAIAFAGAMARSHTQGDVKKIKLSASANIIKNAFVVGIPGTDMTGLQSAVAIGAACNNPQEKLALLDAVQPEQVAQAKEWVSSGIIEIEKADVEFKLYIKAAVMTEQDEATVEIVGSHTNISKIVKNGKMIYNGNCNTDPSGAKEEKAVPDFNLKDVYDFCMTASLEELAPIKIAIELNSKISQEGMTNDYGLRVGKTIQSGVHKNYMADDLTNYAMMMTAAGSDARMAGVSLSVMSNSGSGNQGIAATIPVYSVWQRIGQDQEQLIRACALSNLVTIYIKKKFGVLSALCGAVVAGSGSACGITYLMGGNFEQMEIAIHNVLGNVAGMLCDGAKSSCALKISSCTNAAMQASMLAMNHLRIQSNEGIVERLSENTIDNFALLGNEGSEALDRLVLDMIINKK